MGMATGESDWSTTSFQAQADPWLTVSQVAAILGIPKSEVKRKYPYIVIEGGTRLFHWKDIGYNPKTGAM